MNKRDGHKRFHGSGGQLSGPTMKTNDSVLAETVKSQPQIYHFLRERVKGQDTSLNGLASILSSLLACRKSHIYRALLGGASGSGKTTTVHAVKQLLGMGEGQRYARQFIEISGVTVNDAATAATQRVYNREKEALVKRLNKAKRATSSSDTGKKEPYPYLCLFVDDVDKATHAFIDFLGLLLERSVQKSTADGFTLPARTPLLVLFTSSSASDEIGAMKKNDDLMASDMVRRAFSKRWQNSSLMKHLEPILPFYPLKTETLRPILLQKFDEYVTDSGLTSRFGQRAIQYSDEVKHLLVDHVLARVNTSHGIQGSIGQLFYRLDIFFSTGLGIINTMVSENEQLLRPIQVTAHSIDTHRFAESLDKQLDSVIQEFKQQQQQQLVALGPTVPTSQVIDAIMTNPENQQIMGECDPGQEGKVNAVTMAYGDRPLCSLVVNIIYNNYQVVNHHDQHEEVQRLKRKMRGYKHTLKEVIETIDRTCKESTFNDRMRQFADAKRELVESSNTSSSDESDDHSYQVPSLTHSVKRPNKNKKRPHSTSSHITNTSTSSGGSPLIASGGTIPLTKRIRLAEEDEDMTLDFSDEIDFYLKETNIFTDDDEEDEGTLNMEEWAIINSEESCHDSSNEEEEQEKEDLSSSPIYEVVIEELSSPLGVEVVSATTTTSRIECPRCGKAKPIEAFTRKRKTLHGQQIRTAPTQYCNTCRK